MCTAIRVASGCVTRAEADGTLRTFEARILLDGGAYRSSSCAVISNACVLRGRALPRRRRAGRRSCRAHQQPTVRRHAWVRCGAGVLRPRGADGSAGSALRPRPRRAAPAQRSAAGRHAAHRPGRGWRSAGRRGDPCVRGAARASRHASRRWRRCHVAPGRLRSHRRCHGRAAGQRVRGRLQEPHVRRGLHGRLRGRGRSARRPGDCDVRGGRGRPGLRHAGPADRPHGARRRRRARRAC